MGRAIGRVLHHGHVGECSGAERGGVDRVRGNYEIITNDGRQRVRVKLGNMRRLMGQEDTKYFPH